MAAPARLSRTARSTIDRAAEIGVSTMSFWELALLARAGRVELARGARNWVRSSLAADERLVPLPVTAEIALTAGGFAFTRDPGDCIIYATAVEHDALLVSKDARLQDHDPKRVVW